MPYSIPIPGFAMQLFPVLRRNRSLFCDHGRFAGFRPELVGCCHWPLCWRAVEWHGLCLVGWPGHVWRLGCMAGCVGDGQFVGSWFDLVTPLYMSSCLSMSFCAEPYTCHSARSEERAESQNRRAKPYLLDTSGYPQVGVKVVKTRTGESQAQIENY